MLGMQIVRFFGRLLAILLLQLAIIWLVLSVVFLQVLATPEPIKQSLSEAGFYQVLVSEVSEHLVEQSDKLRGDVAAVRAAVDDAIDADVVQRQVEQAIDSTYDWLRGDSETLAFALDFDNARTTFVESLGDNMAEQLRGLPACTTPAQLQTTADPWELSCLPPGFDVNEQREQYVASLLASEDFLPAATISSDELFREGEFDPGESNAPRYFQLLEYSLWPAVGLVIMASLAVVLVNQSKKRGVRKLGWHYISNGALLVLSAGLLWLMLDRLMAIDQATTLQLSVLEALEQLFRQVAVVIALVGTGVLAIGAVLRAIFKKPEKK